jgi:lysophospholipid hydrolase
MQLNFWSFAMLFCLCAVALNYWIRFRYLNTYAQLKEPPLLKSDAQELHPDVNTTETPPAFHTYLDEFLQAVRIFGFLGEARTLFQLATCKYVPTSHSQVFHELARHLQTRRLIAGDTLSLDEDRSFYCVIDGMVQVYAPSGKPTEFQSGSWDNEHMNGYELMNRGWQRRDALEFVYHPQPIH